MSELPTITFRTETGAHRRIDYKRDPRDPTNVWRVVQRFDSESDEWRPVGKESLAELVIDGEHQMPRGMLLERGGR